MKKYTKIFLLLFIGIIVCHSALSQSTERAFNQNQLRTYQGDKDYQYELLTPEPEGAIQKWLRSMRDWFWSLFDSQSSRDFANIIFKLLLFGVFIYFLIKIFGIEMTQVFKPAVSQKTDLFQLSEDHLDRIDFDSEIALALENRDYRKSIRLIYLQALFMASQLDLIDLKQGKTNREYVQEMSQHNLGNEFNELAYLFDYTWYGHFEVNEKLSLQAKQYLTNLDKKWRHEG